MTTNYNTYEEQDALVERIKNGDSIASDLLFEQVKNLISSHAIAVYKSYGVQFNIEYDDIFQEGVVGYLVALDRYKSEFNVKFTTFANNWIKKYCYKLVSTETGVDYIQRKRKGQINSLREQGKTDEEIKTELGLTEARFRNVEDLPIILSMDNLTSDENGNETTFSSYVSFQAGNDNDIAREIERDDCYKELTRFIETDLTEVEKDCLLYLTGGFGYEPSTIENVMDKHKIKEAYKVRNIRAATIKKVRMFLAINKYKYVDFAY